MHLGLVALVVTDYDPAISFFVDALGFELVEDSPALTNDGRPKRWVVVRPPGAGSESVVERWLAASGTSVRRRLSDQTRCANGRRVRTETGRGEGTVRSSSPGIWSASEVAARAIARLNPPRSSTST